MRPRRWPFPTLSRANIESNSARCHREFSQGFWRRKKLGRLHKSVAQGFCDRFALGVDLQFLVDLLEVKVDRAWRDFQFGGGGFVAVAVDQQLQNANLMRSQ